MGLTLTPALLDDEELLEPVLLLALAAAEMPRDLQVSMRVLLLIMEFSFSVLLPTWAWNLAILSALPLNLSFCKRGHGQRQVVVVGMKNVEMCVCVYISYQSSGVGNEGLLLGELGHALASNGVVEDGAVGGQGGVGLEILEGGSLGRDLGLEGGSLGGVVLGDLIEQGLVGGDLLGLLDAGHLATLLVHGLDGEDLVAGVHEGGVAGEGGQLGGGLGGLGLELLGLGGVALGDLVELGGVGGDFGDGGQLLDLSALGLGGGASGGVAGGLVLSLVVSLGDGEAGQGEDESGRELHVDGGGWVVVNYKNSGAFRKNDSK